MNWSPQQDAIFRWFAAPSTANLVVRARAGTGKTTTIVEAIRHIGMRMDKTLVDAVAAMEEEGKRILLCAFNKRVQQELMRRIPDDGRVDVKTLHALGFMYLKGAWGNLHLDNDVEDERVRSVIGDGPSWEVASAIKKLVSIAKGALPTSTDVLVDLALVHNCEVDDHHNFSVEQIAAAARQVAVLARTCDEAGRITFDDMLFVPVANNLITPLYDWVIVDEAQDMNAAQLVLATKSCKSDGHIVVVGDDRQSIYSFRGADSHALDRLKAELQADELGLMTTYRCPRSVVAVAAQLVPDIEAATDAPDGSVDHLAPAELLDNVLPGDVILSRVNAPLVPLCLGLIRRHVAARIEGRDIGKALAVRVRKLKATSVTDFDEKLNRWADRARRRAIAHGRCVEQQLQEITDVKETLGALVAGCETVAELLTRCETMFSDVGAGAPTMVVLSSIHKAKGLEWPRVFLLAETLYCYGKRREDREEANIHYTAVTRAKESLILVQ